MAQPPSPPSDASSPAVARIEAALARIEQAAAARAFAADRLARRHHALRSRIEQAVASLDALIARENGGEADEAP